MKLPPDSVSVLERALDWQRAELAVGSAIPLKGRWTLVDDAFRGGYLAGMDASLAPPVEDAPDPAAPLSEGGP